MEQTTFTEGTREFCLYIGLTGMLMAGISIIHYFIAAPDFHWILILLCIPNIYVFITCLLVARLNRWVIIMLGICLLLFFVYFIFVFFLMTHSFVVLSPSSMVLFIFTFAVFIYALIVDLHSKLQENHLARKADAEYWNGKI